MAADVARCTQHVLHVGAAIFTRWGAHRNELDGAKVCGPFNVIGEMQAPGLHIALHHVLQARLKNGDLPPLQHRYFGGIGVKTNDIVADFRQAGARDQPNIAGAYYSDFHKDKSTDVTRVASLNRISRYLRG